MSRYRTSKQVIVLLLLAVSTLSLALVSLSLGSVSIPIRDVLLTLLGQSSDNSLIIMQLRLPRIVAAILIGAGLAVSGVLLQGIIRNPLASPELLGVTGGASVAVSAFMTFFVGYSVRWVPFIAIAGAFIAAGLNYTLAWKKGVSPYSLVLIGMGISAAAQALTMFFLISGPSYLAAQVLNWTIGSVYGTNWQSVANLWPWMAIFIPVALLFARELNIQSLGEAAAIGLGSRVQLSRFVLLLSCVALAGAAVGTAGTLSFIGLLAPHMARRIAGYSYAVLIPASAFTGAILLLGADLAGRMLFMPLDIPAGVFTAGIGAPFFMYLLFKRRSARGV